MKKVVGFGNQAFQAGLVIALKYALIQKRIYENEFLEVLDEAQWNEYFYNTLYQFIDDNPGALVCAVCEGYLELKEDFWNYAPDKNGEWLKKFPQFTKRFWEKSKDFGFIHENMNNQYDLIALDDFEVAKFLKPYNCEFVKNYTIDA